MGRISFMVSPKELEKDALDQITKVVDNFSGAEFPYIAIMSDAHPGAGCVIGFTAKIGTVLLPSFVGVDIGCGVASAVINKADIGKIDLDRFDRYVKTQIPRGKKHRGWDTIQLTNMDSIQLYDNGPPKCFTMKEFKQAVDTQIATLGGGNHFIEIESSEDKYFFTVHSGSRNIGHKIASYHIDKAYELHQAMHSKITNKYDAFFPFKQHNKEGMYKYAWDYLDDMMIAQEFAKLNRKYMLKIMMNFFSIPDNKYSIIESIHNYIDFEHWDNKSSLIMRKGAIPAYEGEKVLIPLTMADGLIYGRGKSSSKWNYSAPHGAGRISSRAAAFDTLSMDEFKNRMEGIYSSTVVAETLDESPMAYKDPAMIINSIQDTVEIIDILKPIYNVKAVEPRRQRKGGN